jgi:RNA polymerase sigma-70 factor (ECF subfamily)
MEQPGRIPLGAVFDSNALDRELYEALRRIAGRAMSGERAEHTLQPTALVHEVYLELSVKEIAWGGRQHFLAAAALQMRRILVDHARAAQREKRGGDLRRVTLSGVQDKEPDVFEVDVADLDDALTELEGEEPIQARIVELSYFGGLSYDEVADVTGLSRATVGRELRFARAWLRARLTRG